MQGNKNAAGGRFPPAEAGSLTLPRALCTALLLVASAIPAPAWVESVEFPWNAYPRQYCERELVWLKNIGFTHVSLPPATSPAATSQLNEVIRILRRIDLEADLEGPIPEALLSLARAHGGPLTDPLPGQPTRISALSPDAIERSRKLMMSGNSALVWTDVEDTIGPSGYHSGAVSFSGRETPAFMALRRSAQLTRYWGQTMSSLRETTLDLKNGPSKPPPAEIAVRQFSTEKNGASLITATNSSPKSWTGDLRAFYPAVKRIIALPNVTVPAHESVWLPINIPLLLGPLCRNCNAFATVDHLVYATAELTAMEYENGVLAMEFSAAAAGEVILQLSREPMGPLVAGGRPTAFDWDEHTQRVRLPIPKGAGAGNHVRIGLAIQAPDSTAFFETARVLLIGETNRLTAEYSSDAIAQRSRVKIAPAFPVMQEPAKEPLKIVYNVRVPESVIPGDYADLSIEADGLQMSHARPQLLRPATLRFTDAIAVHLAANSELPLFPATVPVNQRTGREVSIAIRNNAPEIRNFTLELRGEGLDFTPAKIDVTIGASATREVTFRAFATTAAAGAHSGEARLSGAASATEAVRFIVIPPNGAVAFADGIFSILESAKQRASFLPGRWLEFVNKENGQNGLPPGGRAFTEGPIEPHMDALVFGGKRTVRLPDLEKPDLKE